jgi:hypothetical protein
MALEKKAENSVLKKNTSLFGLITSKKDSYFL